MAKKDDIILIIAKSFGKQKLTQEEIEVCKSLSVAELIVEYGLSQDQSHEVVSWCALSCAKLNNETHSEVLEEGLFSLLRKNKDKDKTQKTKPEMSLRQIYTAFLNYVKNYDLGDINETSEFLVNARNFNNLIIKKGLHTAMRNPHAEAKTHLDLIDAAAGDKKFLHYQGVPAKYISKLGELIKMSVVIHKASLRAKKNIRASLSPDHEIKVQSARLNNESIESVFVPARGEEDLYKKLAGRDDKKVDYYKFEKTFMNQVNKNMFGRSANLEHVASQIKEIHDHLVDVLSINSNKEKLLLLVVLQQFTLRLCHALDKNIKMSVKSTSSHYYRK